MIYGALKGHFQGFFKTFLRNYNELKKKHNFTYS